MRKYGIVYDIREYKKIKINVKEFNKKIHLTPHDNFNRPLMIKKYKKDKYFYMEEEYKKYTCDSDDYMEHKNVWHDGWINMSKIENNEIYVCQEDDCHIADIQTINNKYMKLQETYINNQKIGKIEEFFKEVIWIVYGYNLEYIWINESIILIKQNKEKLNDMKICYFDLNSMFLAKKMYNVISTDQEYYIYCEKIDKGKFIKTYINENYDKTDEKIDESIELNITEMENEINLSVIKKWKNVPIKKLEKIGFTMEPPRCYLNLHKNISEYLNKIKIDQFKCDIVLELENIINLYDNNLNFRLTDDQILYLKSINIKTCLLKELSTTLCKLILIKNQCDPT